MKTHRGVQHHTFLNSALEVWVTLQPSHFNFRERALVPIGEEAGWVPEPV
jgi:hypothetical protein